MSITTHGFGSPTLTTLGWGAAGAAALCPKRPRMLDAVLVRPRMVETDRLRPRAVETDRLRPRMTKSEEDC